MILWMQLLRIALRIGYDKMSKFPKPTDTLSVRKVTSKEITWSEMSSFQNVTVAFASRKEKIRHGFSTCASSLYRSQFSFFIIELLIRYLTLSTSSPSDAYACRSMNNDSKCEKKDRKRFNKTAVNLHLSSRWKCASPTKSKQFTAEIYSP